MKWVVRTARSMSAQPRWAEARSSDRETGEAWTQLRNVGWQSQRALAMDRRRMSQAQLRIRWLLEYAVAEAPVTLLQSL